MQISCYCGSLWCSLYIFVLVCFAFTLKVCENIILSKFMWTISPTYCAHFMFPGNVFVIFMVLYSFSLLFYMFQCYDTHDLMLLL